MSLLLNIIWILLGGAWMAFGWLVAAVIMAITIVGIPWARAAVNIALYTLMPFGYTAVPRDRLTGEEDIGTGVLGGIGNLGGAVVGGILLGLVEALGAGYLGALTGGVLGSHYADIFAFVVLIAVLTLRPSGLLGERVADRA